MSHTVTLEIKLRNRGHLRKACQALGVEPTQETVQFYDKRRVTGTVIRFDGWKYPVVIDASGSVHFDDYDGAWGNVDDVHRLQVQYAVAAAQEMKAEGWHMGAVQTLSNGAQKLTLTLME